MNLFNAIFRNDLSAPAIRFDGRTISYGELRAETVTMAQVISSLGAGAPLLPRRVELRLEELGRNGDFVTARFTVPPPNGPE